MGITYTGGIVIVSKYTLLERDGKWWVECEGSPARGPFTQEHALYVKAELEALAKAKVVNSQVVVFAGSYSGRIIAIEGGLVIQKTGRDGMTVLHDASNLLPPTEKPIDEGDVVDINYTDGIGAVAPEKEKGVRR